MQFANPTPTTAAPGLDAVSRGISSSSSNYLGAVDNGLKALSSLDLSNPKSITNLIQHFTLAQAQGVQLTAVLSEVSNSKRSLQTLFQNQG